MSAPNTAHQVLGRRLSQKIYTPANSCIKVVVEVLGWQQQEQWHQEDVLVARVA
jgi:hypothetical protein